LMMMLSPFMTAKLRFFSVMLASALRFLDTNQKNGPWHHCEPRKNTILLPKCHFLTVFDVSCREIVVPLQSDLG